MGQLGGWLGTTPKPLANTYGHIYIYIYIYISIVIIITTANPAPVLEFIKINAEIVLLS